MNTTSLKGTDKKIYFKTRQSAINAAENLNYDYGSGTWIFNFDSNKSKWFIQMNIYAMAELRQAKEAGA
jgi:hypothetical protein